jgi:predicted enzyme related to lactoylglutathione lyase
MPKASAANVALNKADALKEVVPLGGIAWNEYATSDVGKAREFFAALFGWSARVKEFAFEGAYTTFTCDGRDVAGLLSLKDLSGAGRKPGWFPVIRTNSVDNAAARAIELGASVLSPPTGLPGLDRHAMLAGPSQGRYALLELGESEIIRGAGCVGWNELRVTNPSATALFFWQTFGWNAESLWDDRDGLVTTFLQGGKRVASMRKAAPDEMSRCMPCIEVMDVQATVRKATELGGALLDGRVDDPVLGNSARINDPLGSDFVVFSRAS